MSDIKVNDDLKSKDSLDKLVLEIENSLENHDYFDKTEDDYQNEREDKDYTPSAQKDIQYINWIFKKYNIPIYNLITKDKTTVTETKLVDTNGKKIIIDGVVVEPSADRSKAQDNPKIPNNTRLIESSNPKYLMIGCRLQGISNYILHNLLKELYTKFVPSSFYTSVIINNKYDNIDSNISSGSNIRIKPYKLKPISPEPKIIWTNINLNDKNYIEFCVNAFIENEIIINGGHIDI